MSTPIAAYKGKLSITGTTTATTGEACAVVSGKTYQITNAAKRVLDPAVARTWKDNGSGVSAANILSEDLLFGTVTFIPGYTPTTPITVDCNYLPRIAVAAVKQVKLSYKLNSKPNTPINGTGDQTIVGTTRSLSMTATLYDDLRTDLDSGTGGEQSFATLLIAATPKLFEYDFKGDGTRVLRAWMIPEGFGDDVSSPDDLVMGDISWSLSDRSPSLTANASFEFGAA